jgi:hypothetical protein
LIALLLAAAAWSIDLSAHRVIGRTYPGVVGALVQSPTASPTDLPIPIFNTGLSVICIRVTNTTSPADVRITALGLELPGTLSGFSLLSPLDRGLAVQENVQQLPGFPDVTLDVSVVTGTNFTSGRPRLGLLPSTTPMTICLSGPFNPATPIETLLNGVFVRFEGGESYANATDIGVWERR